MHVKNSTPSMDYSDGCGASTTLSMTSGHCSSKTTQWQPPAPQWQPPAPQWQPRAPQAKKNKKDRMAKDEKDRKDKEKKDLALQALSVTAQWAQVRFQERDKWCWVMINL